MPGDIWGWIIVAGIPSAIIGFFFTRFNKKLDKREKIHTEKEDARIKNEMMIVKMLMTSLALSEATAQAVSRIPDANCNGDMHDALNSVKKAKDEYREFEREQIAKSLR